MGSIIIGGALVMIVVLLILILAGAVVGLIMEGDPALFHETADSGK